MSKHPSDCDCMTCLTDMARRSQNTSRIAEIRERVSTARDQIANGARMDGNRLVIGLEFEDERQLVQKWLQAIADCNSLLCILDGGKPI